MDHVHRNGTVKTSDLHCPVTGVEECDFSKQHSIRARHTNKSGPLVFFPGQPVGTIAAFDNSGEELNYDQLYMKFIDTEPFQRLHDLKQLGEVHSRFEHSLGVYWSAGDAVQKLQYHQGSELDIDKFDIQTVKLAGLLHNVGHGPYIHVFEREFLPGVLDGSTWSREAMSVRMVDYIVDEHCIDINPDSIKRVKSTKEKHFLYDIVANGRNGLDFDKFDYIVRDCRVCGLGCNFQFQRLLETMRVMGDEICYRAKDYLSIHKLLLTRADLQRMVYTTHAKVKLDDTILKAIETAPDQELKKARDLILRIRRRDLYQFCNEYAVPKDQLDHFKEITAQDIVCSQKSNGITLKEEDVAVSNVKIDFARGKDNPLESINFFKDYDSKEKFCISDARMSHLLPTSFQDRIVRVY